MSGGENVGIGGRVLMDGRTWGIKEKIPIRQNGR